MDFDSRSSPRSELNFLRAPGNDERPRVIIVSPHPDDEVIGAGSRLRLLKGAVVVQVTDGSPRDLLDAHSNGFQSCEAYGRARRDELLEALSIAGIQNSVELGIPDQEASLAMASLTKTLAEVISRERPDIVMSVPYEGGHPDHDATAFAVHSAIERLEDWNRPLVIEMTAYHNSANGCAFCDFVGAGGGELVIQLTAEECAIKRRMFECFRTQKKVLQWFPIGLERFRVAPRYDFTTPPHDGPLYYELFPWGMAGARWRALAQEAADELKADWTGSALCV